MIAIIGAGITGLALAHELDRRGEEVVVVEAAPEPGGVMRSLRVQRRVLELGPQRTRLTPQLRALVDELGLGSELITAPPDLPLFVYRGGKLRRVPFSLREAATTSLISWHGKARVLLEPLTRGPRSDDSVASFLIRKFGREVYEVMLGPLYGGLYASDPEEMPLRYSLAEALRNFGIEGSILLALARKARRGGDTAPACSFRGGMRVLTDALHAAHRERVHLASPILAIRRDGERFVLEGLRERIECDRVVLTTPADVAAGLLASLAPDAARLERLTYNPLAVVHLHASCTLRGMGYQVAFGERLETRGVTFNESLFGRDGVYTAYLGGARNPEMVRLPELRIGAIAAAEFELVTGCPAEVLHVGRVRMPAWDRSWAALEGLTLPPGIHLAANYESRAGVPGRLLRARQLAMELAPDRGAPS